MTVEHCCRGLAGNVPDTETVIVGRRDDFIAVRTELGMHEGAAVPSQNRGYLSVGGFPDARCLVLGRGDDESTVGAERCAGHPPLVPLQFRDLAPVCSVEKFGRNAIDDHAAAIWTELSLTPDGKGCLRACDVQNLGLPEICRGLLVEVCRRLVRDCQP